MSKGLRINGFIRRHLQFSLYFGIILVLINLQIYLFDIRAGILLSAFLLCYIGILVWMNLYSKKFLMRDMVSFATGYAQVQKRLLKEFDLPYAVIDENNRLIWVNDAFQGVIGESNLVNKAISHYIPSITREKLPIGEEELVLELEYEQKAYRAKIKCLQMENDLKEFQGEVEEEFDGKLWVVHLYDETALKFAMQEVEDQSVAVGLFYLDNYDEALDSIEEVRRSLLIALIDRKVNKYISSYDGICKKIEKDKYLVVLRKKAVKQLQESKFDLIEDIKTVSIGNDMAVTMSVGVGCEGITYAQNYEYARNAVDLALGRGGDQVVLKTPAGVVYYGGKSQQIEKNTRVKARVKAHALKEIIASKDKVLVMGHRHPDVDSFGAALGIYRIAKLCDKKAHIVLNDSLGGLQSITDYFIDNPEYEEDMIVHPRDAELYVTSNTVLVIVDVNKPSITECPELLRLCKTVVVFDHHRQGEEVIENATLSYIEPFASSTCEMVTEILQYTTDNIKIKGEEADCLYAGIVVDTNYFVAKTGVRTFEAAAFLKRNGADVTRVRKLFREDAIAYKTRADAVSQAEIYRNKYAITICSNDEGANLIIVGAQAANELLNIKGVRASFVLTEYQGKINISARSIDEVNVQVIMERLGGGGHMSVAACQFENVSLAEAEGVLKKTIDKMIEEGDLT